jgi:Hemerythrin HHE cation binding domain
MTAIHDALRRDLDVLLDTTASQARAQARWAVFRDQLDFYIAAEQAVMWLPARAWLVGDPRARALLDGMDDERGLIGPLRAVTDDAFTMGADPGRRRQLLVRLRTKLASHLAHEEAEALPCPRASSAGSPGPFARLPLSERGAHDPVGTRPRQPQCPRPGAGGAARTCPAALPGGMAARLHAPRAAAGSRPGDPGKERPHMPMTAAPAVSADWMSLGACRDADPDLFLPIGSLGPAQRQTAQAKAVCAPKTSAARSGRPGQPESVPAVR